MLLLVLKQIIYSRTQRYLYLLYFISSLYLFYKRDNYYFETKELVASCDSLLNLKLPKSIWNHLKFFIWGI